LFEHLGINLKKGDYTGKLIICASGRCVWSDMEMAGEGEYMAVNDMIMHLPFRLSHAYSNDPIMLPRWKAARRPDYNQDFITHSCYGGSDRLWPWPGHGTSSLNAVYTGLALGYDEIILCGIPLDDSGHYFDPPWKKSNFHNEVPLRDGELKYWKGLKGYPIKSMSGRTKELFNATLP